MGISAQPLLEVKDLTVRFGGQAAVEGISFGLEAGETLGLVGESGSGKSASSLAILRLLDVRRDLRFDLGQAGDALGHSRTKAHKQQDKSEDLHPENTGERSGRTREGRCPPCQDPAVNKNASLHWILFPVCGSKLCTRDK